MPLAIMRSKIFYDPATMNLKIPLLRSRLLGLLSLLVLFSFAPSLRAQGLLFTLRSGSFLSKEPSYAIKSRLSIALPDVLVESPPLQEEGEFCQYRLVDKEGRSFKPDKAWTPCYSIDRLFVRP